MRKLDLNLGLFDGEGAAAPAAGQAGEGAAEASQAAGVQTESGGQKEGEGSRAEMSPEERMAAFEKLIKGEYKEQYDARVQEIVKNRVNDTKRMEQQLREQADIISLVAKKYNLASDQMKDIQSALEADDMFWEEAAADQGMSVESYKKMVKLEAENDALRRAREEAERKNQRDEVFRKWDKEAEELKKYYSSFDFRTEIQDQRFLDLMGAGIDMKTIYETLHHDEIIPELMKQTATNVAKKQAQAVRSGQMRPAEAGLSNRPPAQMIKDPSKMTKAERQEYARRAARGEIITFRE